MLSIETIRREYGVAYRMPCGSEYNSDYVGYDEAEARHEATCATCRVVSGKSRATVMPQADVARLFALGIDGRRSSTDNYSSSAGVLYHYRTIEGVRLRDGTVIRNSQCWSAGFASCSLHAPTWLPLTAIREALGLYDAQPLRDLEIVDRTELRTLVRYGERCLLSGRDGWAPYLIELADPAENVANALLGLMPPEVRLACIENRPVERQGEIWFVKQEPTAEEVETVPWRARFKQTATTGFERRLIRPSILGTHHTATVVLEAGPRRTFVQGVVRHIPESRQRRADHPALRLGEGWWLALKNTAKAAWRVEARGRGGVD